MEGEGGEEQGVHCRGGAHHDEAHRGPVGAGCWTDIATNIFSKHLKCSFSYRYYSILRSKSAILSIYQVSVPEREGEDIINFAFYQIYTKLH